MHAIARRRAIRAIGAYQVIGGGGGAAVMLWTWFIHPEATPWGSIVLALAPYSLLYAAGVAAWRARMDHARYLAVLAQVPQILWVNVTPVAWKFSGGLYAVAVMTPTETRLGAGVDFSLLSGWSSTVSASEIGINGVPILVLVLTLVLTRGGRSAWRVTMDRDRVA